MKTIKKGTGIVTLIFVDIVAISICLTCTLFIRKNILPYFLTFPDYSYIKVVSFWWIYYIWLFFFAYEGLYTKRFSFWDEVNRVWKVSFFSTLAIFAVLYLGKIGEQVSRTVIVVMGGVSMALMPLIRIYSKRFLFNLGLLKSKALVLGAGKTGAMILNALKKDRNFGINVVGFLDDDPAKIGTSIQDIKVHPGVDKAHKYIDRCGVEDVIIAMPGCNKDRLISLINTLQHKVRNILLIPDLFGITVLGTNLQHFFQEQAIGLQVKNNLADPANLFVKKTFDIVVSFTLLFILALPMIIIALLIKSTSEGPIIYAHTRIGRDGKVFQCYKFRTMFKDAEERLKILLQTCEKSRTEWDHHWKLTDDPRITRIGQFLRQTSLDELPQIFNVIKGEMSLVGPRPVTQAEIDEYYKDQAQLCFGVIPGVTGLWQVSGRSNTSYDYRIALDSWYVRNWNLWLDIVILFKTLRVIMKREGAS